MGEPTAADMETARELLDCMEYDRAHRPYSPERSVPIIIEALERARAEGAKAAWDAGFKQAMAWLRGQADEWRGGASSVKGHHMPLKHVYRWLDRMEEYDEPGSERLQTTAEGHAAGWVEGREVRNDELAEARAEGAKGERSRVLGGVLDLVELGGNPNEISVLCDELMEGLAIMGYDEAIAKAHAAGRAEMAGEVREVIQASIDDFEALMIDDPDCATQYGICIDDAQILLAKLPEAP